MYKPDPTKTPRRSRPVRNELEPMSPGVKFAITVYVCAGLAYANLLYISDYHRCRPDMIPAMYVASIVAWPAIGAATGVLTLAGQVEYMRANRCVTQ